jgi:hypothetical protein
MSPPDAAAPSLGEKADSLDAVFPSGFSKAYAIIQQRPKGKERKAYE